MLTLILLAVAAICFGLATVNVNFRGANLTAAGLLAWVLSELIPALVK